PQVYSGMIFELRRVPSITSRIVKKEGRAWELWSPNSTQTPFLPGCRTPGLVPAIPTKLEERRYDGHCGRFDCLYSPQYSADHLPHWPFIRRPHLVAPGDFAYSAYEPLMRQWVVNKLNPCKGVFRPDYLESLSALRQDLDAHMNAAKSLIRPGSSTWDKRPLYADATRIAELSDTEYWWEAVDKGMGVQRGLREKEAWLTMVHTRRFLDPLQLEELRQLEFPPANERYLGVWVNGLHEGTVLCYLCAGIPCFVVHSYATEDRTRADVHPGVPSYSDFVVGTDIVLSLREGPYQQLARRDAVRLDALESQNTGSFRPMIVAPEHEQCSSSLYLEQLGIAQASKREESVMRFRLDGWRGAKVPTPATIPSSPASQAPSFHAPLLTYPKESPVKDNRYAHREVERQTIHASRVDWIVPPPVAERRDANWGKWELDLLESGLEAFVYRGTKHTPEADKEWFDRTNGRRIFLSDYQVPPGVVNSGVFGSPVPHFPFERCGRTPSPGVARY
ncbi:hypothetical protein R3P38DRAFT_2541864, partial [Favolaschia claudopus]